MLGIVQGLTEFLPVSSSGHLVLGGVVLGLTESHVLFDIVLHVGTLAATLFFYRDTFRQMGRELISVPAQLHERGGWRGALEHCPSLKLAALLVVGCVPTAIVGLVFKHPLEALFARPRAAAGMLLVTAVLLIATRWTRPVGRGIERLRIIDALLIGLVQGVAIVPGISRSGSTIAVALFVGIDRELAARFSFLLSIPAIVGALLLKLSDGSTEQWHAGASPLVAGFLAAAVVGVAALAMLIPLVRRGRFHVFACYLLPVALAALVWLP